MKVIYVRLVPVKEPEAPKRKPMITPAFEIQEHDLKRITPSMLAKMYVDYKQDRENNTFKIAFLPCEMVVEFMSCDCDIVKISLKLPDGYPCEYVHEVVLTEAIRPVVCDMIDDFTNICNRVRDVCVMYNTGRLEK